MNKIFNKILCPMDFDENSMGGLRLACELAEGKDAVIYLFHTVPMVVTAEVPLPMESYVALEAEAKEKLQEIATQQLGDKIRHEVAVAIGEPAHLILEEIKKLGVDSVVMATHGRTGVKRFVLGSVAERVVREAACPVVTVRPPES